MKEYDLTAELLVKQLADMMASKPQNAQELKTRIPLLTHIRDGISCPTLDKSKESNFAIRHFQKKSNSIIDLISLGIYAPGPKVLTYRPQILREVRV